MIAPGANARVYLACGVTDMRKGIIPKAIEIDRYEPNHAFRLR